jgi:hypothetical protein
MVELKKKKSEDPKKKTSAKKQVSRKYPTWTNALTPESQPEQYTPDLMYPRRRNKEAISSYPDLSTRTSTRSGLPTEE